MSIEWNNLTDADRERVRTLGIPDGEEVVEVFNRITFILAWGYLYDSVEEAILDYHKYRKSGLLPDEPGALIPRSDLDADEIEALERLVELRKEVGHTNGHAEDEIALLERLVELREEVGHVGGDIEDEIEAFERLVELRKEVETV